MAEGRFELGSFAERDPVAEQLPEEETSLDEPATGNPTVSEWAIGGDLLQQATEPELESRVAEFVHSGDVMGDNQIWSLDLRRMTLSG